MLCGRLGPLELAIIFGSVIFLLGPRRFIQSVRNAFKELIAMREAVKKDGVTKEETEHGEK